MELLFGLDFGVVRRSELEDELDELEADDEPPPPDEVSDLRLGVSTPILEHVLASNASGLLFASNCKKKKKKKD